MPQFPHLPLPKKIKAAYKHKGIPIDREIAQQTLDNMNNRSVHGRVLRKNVKSIETDWYEHLEERQQKDYPDLPYPDIIPVLMRIDLDEFNIESLKSIGIEIIAEDDNGYVIGASVDNFQSLRKKIKKFIDEDGKFKNQAARLWEIVTGRQWRVDYILSTELKTKWDQISEGDDIVVDVSIACYLKMPSPPSRKIKKKESAEDFNLRYEKWLELRNKLERTRGELEEKRQDEFDDFIKELQGERLTDFVGYDDSFGCRLRLKGWALKDLVNNYQYLFDVCEFDDLTFIHPETGQETLVDVEFSAPSPDAPRVCIIDSGIQENHLMLEDAIEVGQSRNYVPDKVSAVDEVGDGGHGTKVAGAVLFGNTIPKVGPYQHQFWIQNARILNENKRLPVELYPPELMKTICNDFPDARIFNLSVNASRPCRVVHMSEWATTIDQLSVNENKLFVVSTGNIKGSTGEFYNLGIIEYLNAGINYPQYLFQPNSRLANPAQSCFAITVGSVCSNKFEDEDRESFAEKDESSAFSRSGPGLWRMIKPDVVEYGGDYVREKGENPNLTTEVVSSAEVVRSTLNGLNAIGHDVGTSFAAPKVSHIAASILRVVPNATANLIRALVAQGARMPESMFRTPSIHNLRAYGYGIANKTRSTENSLQRITLTSESIILPRQAEVYTLKVPQEMRGIADDFDFLVEISLAFMSRPRRTRRRTHSYLASWVDWHSSKFDESYDQFKARVTKFADDEEPVEEAEDVATIKWSIRENLDWGTVKGIRRQDSSLQKDWTIIKSHQMPEEFSIAVVGHTGWDKNIKAEIPYSLAVSFEVLNSEIPIYNLIRILNEIEVEQEIDNAL